MKELSFINDNDGNMAIEREEAKLFALSLGVGVSQFIERGIV